MLHVRFKPSNMVELMVELMVEACSKSALCRRTLDFLTAFSVILVCLGLGDTNRSAKPISDLRGAGSAFCVKGEKATFGVAADQGRAS